MREEGKIEILYEECDSCGCGWFGYQDWGYAGKYFFKSYVPDCSLTAPRICNQWIRMSPFACSSQKVEYFDTKKECEDAIKNGQKEEDKDFTMADSRGREDTSLGNEEED